MPSVRVSCYKDVAELAPKLRTEDIQELAAVGQTPNSALITGVLASKYCYSGLNDAGDVICMFGVVDQGDNHTGTIWLLGSPEIPKVSLYFLRETRKYLRLFQAEYALLSNLVDSRNEVHVQWLKWCGFKSLRTVQMNGVPFYEFVRIK